MNGDSKDTARAQALEEAAMWHETQAANLRVHPQYEDGNSHWADEGVHKASAVAIRALAKDGTSGCAMSEPVKLQAADVGGFTRIEAEGRCVRVTLTRDGICTSLLMPRTRALEMIADLACAIGDATDAE